MRLSTLFSKRCLCLTIAISVLLAIVLFLVGFLLPYVTLARNSITRNTRIMQAHNNCTTKAFNINGNFVDKVSIAVTSPADTFQLVTLHVFSGPQPLNIHNVKLYVKHHVINSNGVFIREFYLNVGSVMNITFCAQSETRLLVIRGEGDITDFDNIKDRFQVVTNKTFKPTVDCQSESESDSSRANCSTQILISDSYKFVIETTVYRPVDVTNIVFEADSLQYNVTAPSGTQCVPTHVKNNRGVCDVEVPENKSAMVIVEMTGQEFQIFEFIITTHKRCAYMWNFAKQFVGVASVLLLLSCVLLLLVLKRCLSPKPPSNSSERMPLRSFMIEESEDSSL